MIYKNIGIARRYQSLTQKKLMLLKFSFVCLYQSKLAGVWSFLSMNGKRCLPCILRIRKQLYREEESFCNIKQTNSTGSTHKYQYPSHGVMLLTVTIFLVRRKKKKEIKPHTMLILLVQSGESFQHQL